MVAIRASATRFETRVSAPHKLRTPWHPCLPPGGFRLRLVWDRLELPASGHDLSRRHARATSSRVRMGKPSRVSHSWYNLAEWPPSCRLFDPFKNGADRPPRPWILL